MPPALKYYERRTLVVTAFEYGKPEPQWFLDLVADGKIQEFPASGGTPAYCLMTNRFGTYVGYTGDIVFINRRGFFYRTMTEDDFEYYFDSSDFKP